MEDTGLFFDLQRELTTNVTFVNKIEKIMKDITLTEKEGKIKERNMLMHEALKLCDYNASLFVPYYFPDFARGKPMTLWSRPHSMAMMSMVPNGSLVIQASRQIGKCCDGSTKLTIREDSSGDSADMTIEDLFNSIEHS